MYLETYYKNIALNVLSRTIDEVVITNKGKNNFFIYQQIKSMKERFGQKQKAQLYDEQTLDPLDIVIDSMVTVKLEVDM